MHGPPHTNPYIKQPVMSNNYFRSYTNEDTRGRTGGTIFGVG